MPPLAHKTSFSINPSFNAPSYMAFSLLKRALKIAFLSDTFITGHQALSLNRSSSPLAN